MQIFAFYIIHSLALPPAAKLLAFLWLYLQRMYEAKKIGLQQSVREKNVRTACAEQCDEQREEQCVTNSGHHRRLHCPPPLLPAAPSHRQTSSQSLLSPPPVVAAPPRPRSSTTTDASECHAIHFAARLRAPLVVRLSDGAQKNRDGI